MNLNKYTIIRMLINKLVFVFLNTLLSIVLPFSKLKPFMISMLEPLSDQPTIQLQKM